MNKFHKEPTLHISLREGDAFFDLKQTKPNRFVLKERKAILELYDAISRFLMQDNISPIEKHTIVQTAKGSHIGRFENGMAIDTSGDNPFLYTKSNKGYLNDKWFHDEMIEMPQRTVYQTPVPSNNYIAVNDCSRIHLNSIYSPFEVPSAFRLNNS